MYNFRILESIANNFLSRTFKELIIKFDALLQFETSENFNNFEVRNKITFNNLYQL